MARIGIGISGGPSAARSGWLAMIALAMAMALGGCVDLQEIRDARDRATVLRESLGERAAELESLAGSLGPDDPRRTEARARLAETEAALGAVDAAIQRADQILDEAERPAGPIAQTVGMIAPWLPEPARTPLLLAAALAGTALRARQFREASASIVRGLDRAMEDDPALAQQFHRNAPTIRSSQTPTAARIVERTRAGRRREPAQEGGAG